MQVAGRVSLPKDSTNARPTPTPASKVVNLGMVNIKKRNGTREQFSRQKPEESVMKTDEYLDKLRRLQVDMDTLQKITMR